MVRKGYKSRHEWVGKVILRELWYRLKFNHINKWYIQKLESVQENETHKVLWDFKMLTDHPISAGSPDLMLIKKKQRICYLVDFAVLEDHKVKMKESKNIDKYLDLARELEEHESGGDTHCSWFTWNSLQSFGKDIGKDWRILCYKVANVLFFFWQQSKCIFSVWLQPIFI